MTYIYYRWIPWVKGVYILDFNGNVYKVIGKRNYNYINKAFAILGFKNVSS